MATAIAALSDLEQKKLTAVMEMAKPECAGEIRELAKNLELFEFAPKVRTPAEYGRYMIQDSGHYEYDPNLEEFYDYERYGKLRMEKETGAFTEKGYVAYGGMGSFNDLPSMRGNHDYIFDFLKSVCYAFGHLYGKREGISPEVLMAECLHDVEQAAYHPHKPLNQAIAQHLMQGDLQENLDRL